MNVKEIIAAILILILALLITADIPSTEKEYKVKNKETVDGDTIKVTGDISATVRLLGVDTPETKGPNKPDEFGLQDTLQNRKCLKKRGERAAEFTSNFTSNSEISLQTDPRADRRGDYGRLLAYVEKDSKSLGARLLKEGYARVYESDFKRLEEYRELESHARSKGQGLWQCS